MNSFVVRLTTTRAFAWVIKHVASRLDPMIFRATNGRLTSMGPAPLPMVAMTAIGRRSGTPRTVQLAAVEHEGDHLIVASAMGQARHPDWRYNIEANPEVELQMRGERFRARALALTDDDKRRVWPAILRAIPQLRIYATRTDRNIRVFRLRRLPP